MNKNQILIHLRWYVIPLFIFTFVLTFFENFWIFLIIFTIILLVYINFAWKYKNLNFISIIFLLGSLILLSYFLFNYTFYKHNLYSKAFIKKYFIIKDTYKKWQYILTDDFWWTFLAKNMAKGYKLWEKLKIYWMLIPTSWNFKTRSKNFLSTKLLLNKLDTFWQFDYNKFLKMKWINWTIYVKVEYSKNQYNQNFFQKIKQFFSDKIYKLYINYPDKYKALVWWLLIWDKSLLDKKIYKEFINSWLVHIIVVSGWNMMFLIIFLSFILFFIPFYLRLIIIWISITMYAISVWNDSSIIRALIMWLLWLLSLFYGQSVSTKRLLWLAFIIMLLYNPYYLIYDLWFILSFLAIIWILVFNIFQYKTWNDQYIPSIIAYKITFKERKKSISWVKDKVKYLSILYIIKFWNDYFLPTIWASIFTAPAILFFTKQVNLLSFIASLIVIPFVPLIMLVNIIALIMLILWIPGYEFLICINKPLLDLIFYMSDLIGNKWMFFIRW